MTTARIRRSYYACTKTKSTTVKMHLFTDTSVAVASDPFEFYNYLSLKYVSCPSVCRTYNLEKERERVCVCVYVKERGREERSVVVPCTCVNLWIMYINNNYVQPSR